MSRGPGRLQRRILAELEARGEWTTAIELAGCLEAHPVAVRRALHSLRNRGLAQLAHDGLHAFGAEVLMAAALTVAPPSTGHRYPGGLNPKRCVPKAGATTQRLADVVTGDP